MAVGNEKNEAPKLFVSYSWTSPTHIDWVIQLATDLRNLGVEAIIDRWHLREGQDAHSFMESMVRSGEVNKAILICDRKYVDRAEKREGGVGAESQIVTSKIYADVGQTKFVAVIRESSDDGSPAIPNFLSSRVFIDFRDDYKYSEQLQQLVRWAFDKPLYREPEVGPRPSFVDEQVDFEPIRIENAVGSGHNSQHIQSLLHFFDEAIKQKSDFKVEMNKEEENDETIYKSIISLGAIVEQIISNVTNAVFDKELNDNEIDKILEYFSSIFNNYDNGPTNWSGDSTKFFGQFSFTAILSRLIKYRRFHSAKSLLDGRVLKSRFGEITAEALPIGRLNQYLRSLEARNARLKLNRVSLHSDLIKEICLVTKIDFVEYMQADLLICLSENLKKSRWWPDSLLYAADAHGSFPWFARAIDSKFGRNLLSVIGVNSKSDLESLIDRVTSNQEMRISWDSSFATADIRMLANLDGILATFEN